jgi:hypothetical protein
MKALTNLVESSATMNKKGKSKKLRIRPRVGDVVQIPLGKRTFGYGLKLKGTYAFYDAKSPPPLSLAEVVTRPLLFRLWVHDSAVEDGSWPIIGNVPVPKGLLKEPWFFRKDPISGAWSRYRGDPLTVRPATEEECQALECAAVWQPEHVIERLRDYFAGRPSKMVERLRQ